MVTVHLQPGDETADSARRAQVLASIAAWVDAHDESEHDFFVLGDMNFENCAEIAAIVLEHLTALNRGDNCVATNTQAGSPPMTKC